MRMTVAVAAACLGVGAISAASEGEAASTQRIDIPAQGLGRALQSLAKDLHLQLVYATDEVDPLKTAGVAGEMTADQALTELLSGTGLTYRYVDVSTVTVEPITPALRKNGAAQANDGGMDAVDAESQNVGQGTQATERKSFWERFWLRRAAHANTLKTSASSSFEVLRPASLDEVVVTAEKRTEALKDVPIAVTAISGETLADSNAFRFEDYYTSIPGLSFSSGIHGESFIVIRGISANIYSTPSVGIVIDDIPYGSATNLGDGYIAPDIDPSDLARIEVLRGSQGTLYGANSMGGLVKYVTVDPSIDRISGNVQVGTSSVYNGAELGHTARGAINVPLTDTWALRASVFTRLDPGYIDNVSTGERGVNEGRTEGGQFSLLWRPSPALFLKLGALIQDSTTNGLSQVYKQSNLADLQQYVLRGAGRNDVKDQLYSANLTDTVGPCTLYSLTGYGVRSIAGWYDVTPIYGSYANSTFGVAGASSDDRRHTDKFTQELRLSVPIGQRLEWLMGVFFTHEYSPAEETYFAANPTTGQLGLSFLTSPFVSTYKERAVFTDMTLHVTDQFDVQVGGRESGIQQSTTRSLSGDLVGDTVISQGQSGSDAFTYLVAPRLKVAPNLMIFARAASGYRPGGPNLNAALLGLPSKYNPDHTESYEIGIKGDTLDHALSFDASLYYIDWSNIQLSLTQHGLGYFGNGNQAKSQGMELSAELRPASGLDVSAWVTWDDAVLTQPFPSTSIIYGPSGSRLPTIPRFSSNVSFQQELFITDRMTGFVGGTVSYVGDRKGSLQTTAERQNLPAFAKTDLRAGLNYNLWKVDIFVTNVADRRGLLGGGLDVIPTTSFSIIQPRTVGASVTREF